MEKSWIYFLSLILLSGCASDPAESFDDLSDRQRSTLLAKYDKKIRTVHQGSEWKLALYDTLMLLDPEQEAYPRQKSIAYTKRGDFDLAIPLLERSKSLDLSENLYYYSWLTLFHYRDYEKALDLLNQYDDLTPGSRDYAMGQNVNYLKGLALRQLGRYEAAIDEFDKVIKDEEAAVDPYTFVYKGICAYHLGQYDTVHEVMDKALDRFERCTMAMYYRALAYKRQGKNAQAKKWLKKAETSILAGNKKSHPYVEVFDEVHPMTIQDTMRAWTP
jgi:tetratricopeptide (TPR) repeat protein